MTTSALNRFIAVISENWAPISTSVVAKCRQHLSELTLANPAEEWLAELHDEQPSARELLRDYNHGYMLLAHTEQRDLYRPPHDHGRAWVVYGVQSGELEVATYAKLLDAAGKVHLVRRDMHVLRPGEARAYLPGDIHDTRCLSETALLLRFTERDLRHEDRVEQKLTRFVERQGEWTVPGE